MLLNKKLLNKKVFVGSQLSFFIFNNNLKLRLENILDGKFYHRGIYNYLLNNFFPSNIFIYNFELNNLIYYLLLINNEINYLESSDDIFLFFINYKNNYLNLNDLNIYFDQSRFNLNIFIFELFMNFIINFIFFLIFFLKKIIFVMCKFKC